MANPGRAATELLITGAERTELSARLLVRKASENEKLQMRIVLGCADGIRAPRLPSAYARRYRAKVRDVVGLQLTPTGRALVPCVDEKSWIQILHRAQPGPPLTFAKPSTRTHDYKCQETTSLFAALDVTTSTVIGQLKRRLRSAEFLQFLKAIDTSVLGEQDSHLFMNNCGTHKTQAVRVWLAAHPGYHFHFTPNSASWHNLRERFFSQLNAQWIRRSAHTVSRNWSKPFGTTSIGIKRAQSLFYESGRSPELRSDVPLVPAFAPRQIAARQNRVDGFAPVAV